MASGKKFSRKGCLGSVGGFLNNTGKASDGDAAFDEKFLSPGGYIYWYNGKFNKRLQVEVRCGRARHYFVEYYKNGTIKCVGNRYFNHKGEVMKSYNTWGRW